MKLSYYTFTAFIAAAAIALPHENHEAHEPSLYIRSPEPGCIKRSSCSYTYIKRSKEEAEQADEVFLKVREPGCIKRSCSYTYIQRSDIE